MEQHQQDFLAKLKELKQVPDQVRESLEALAEQMTPEQCAETLEQLEQLEGEMVEAVGDVAQAQNQMEKDVEQFDKAVTKLDRDMQEEGEQEEGLAEIEQQLT
ncbi:MAG: hypothetical protein QF741_03790 [Candidatus Peribacteraceae bacterium]|jgi:hypothetical protein|nr:hypothetical protein [Candidatus Peribacteraceae bacterium]MDP7454804.1 hypothetical protein [Candidatus Peribacteraceae bacterium]MDP7646144.1 hypothetical protein [Candidatus Peribacteraceae bacterium]|tara:strand:+ start:133 stop:441 length:309 start_codon:yes stop_codon:yes gene_type:complete